MINNQVHSSVTDKNNMISGQASGDAKAEAGKQQGKGGLFKLLMNSVQGENTNGKGGQAGAGNILGGNITMNTKQEGDGKQSALQLLAGSGEENKEEQITLSRLLEGSGSETEESAGRAADGSKTLGGTVETESADGAGESEGGSNDAVTAEGEPVEENQVSSEGADQALTAKEAEVNEDNTAGESVAGKTADPATAGSASAANGEQTAVAAQAAALAGNGAVNQAASHKEGGKATGGNTPLSGLVQGQESAVGGKQADGGNVLPGDKIINGEVPADSRERGAIGGDIPEGLGNTKSEGLVNELRALAAAHGEQLAAGKQERPAPAHLDGSASEDDAAIVKEIFSALQSGSVEQVAAEIRSLRASQIRESKYSSYLASFANRQDISGAGNSLSAGSGSSDSSAQTGTVSTMMPVSALVPGSASVSGELVDENGAVLWKEQITEYFESKDKSSAENQAAAAFARLGDVPVTNINVRRSFAQGLSRAIITATGQGNKGADVWQKHNFVLEDGKNIQVSAREVDGVLQLKLSSSASELNKLLMEHEKEIRELLENELELKIDLQMDGGGDGNVADFFGGSTGQQSSGKGGNSPLDLGSLRRTEEKQVEKVVPQAVRKFGYNQNEWTV